MITNCTMPSFGLPSSIPLSSSPSPCISSLRSTHIGPGSDSTCAISDGCMSNHLFESPYLPPPPPLSFSEPAPYSPPSVYPPVFPFGPPLLSSARFPPPPNSSYPQPFPNITAFEGPPQYSSDITAYDRWSDRNISTPSGSDNLSKCFTHWPLPSFNSNNSYSNFGLLKPEPAFPPVVPYPPLDSVIKFGPKFSPIPRDSSTSLNAPVMPSTTTASITAPLAASHFSSFPPPNLPYDFPITSSRFPFNPNASSFIPGMDPSSTFGPCDAEFVPESIPSYLSRTGDFLPSSSFQTSDHFHDASPRSIHPAESAPLPVNSSSFWGPHLHTFHGSSSPNALHSYSRSSVNGNFPGPIGNSEATLVHESLCDVAAPAELPYPPPVTGTSVFDFSAAAAPAAQPDNFGFTISPRMYENNVERIVSETGKLTYEHMSPEEWRWKHYEPQYTEVPDVSIFPRSLPLAYNDFHSMDRAAINSPTDVGVRNEGSSLAALKSQKEKLDLIQRSRAESQSGPSLKFAASALAEMVALRPNGGTGPVRSVIGQIPSTSRMGSALETTFPPENVAVDGHFMQELLPEDTCSSSGSAASHKEVNDELMSHRLRRDPTQGYVGHAQRSTIRSEIENLGFVDNAFCDFGGAPVAWALPKVAGQSHNPRPINWIDLVPQSAKGGALQMNGQRRVFSKAPAGIIRQPSISTGSGRLHGVNVDNTTSENLNNSFTYSPNLSPRLQSGRIRKASSQPVVGVRSEDPPSVVSPFTARVEASELHGFDTHLEATAGVLGSQLLADSPLNDEWHVKSTACGSPPPLSQPFGDPHGTISGQTRTAGSTVLADLNRVTLQGSRQVETSYVGTGFHSLTASISNLSKVLLLFDSSSLTPPDSVALEETLQNSILRLSECLLLEQSRINSMVTASHSVGSTPTIESVASRHGRADGSLTTITGVHPAETCGSTNLGDMKVSDGDIVTQGNPGTPTQLSKSGTAAAVTVEEIHNISEQVNSLQLNTVLDFLREHGLLDLSSLERVVNAEAREAKLKVEMKELRGELVLEKMEMEELRGELELEKVESRGAVLLCEKIMQEAGFPRAKTAKLTAEIPVPAQMTGKMKFNQHSPVSTFQGVPTSPAAAKVQMATSSGSIDTCSQRQYTNNVMGPIDDAYLGRSTSILPLEDKKKHFEEGICSDETGKVDSETFVTVSHDISHSNQVESQPEHAHANSLNGTFMETMHQVQSRLAVLAAQCAAMMQSPDSESGDVESRIAILKARPAAPRSPETSADMNGDSESQVGLEALKPAILANSSYVPSRDADQVEAKEPQMQQVRPVNNYPDLSTDISEVEERLALLQARPGWDNELGVFTETEPCTPSDPVESAVSKGGLDRSSLPGVQEEQVAFVKKSMETISDIASQLLRQTQTISNMQNALSQLSEQADSKTQECLYKQDCSAKGGNSTEIYDEGHAIQARALLIRSRPDWAEDEFESESEDCPGGKICKISSQSSLDSGSGRDEYDQFETVNEISIVRLLDSDPEISPLHSVENTNANLSPHGVGGEEAFTEVLDHFELEIVKSIIPKPEVDVEESGWEHVRLSQTESE